MHLLASNHRRRLRGYPSTPEGHIWTEECTECRSATRDGEGREGEWREGEEREGRTDGGRIGERRRERWRGINIIKLHG